MWVVSPPQAPIFPLNYQPAKPPVTLAVSAAAYPSRNRDTSPNRKPRRQTQNQRGAGAVTNQLSGLDVLWAMQKAAAEKNRANKKEKKRKGNVSAAGGRKEEEDVDYSSVRPLCIKSEWSAKLDELDKRLQQLSQTK